MPLSNTQKQLLKECAISEEIQAFLSQELDENGLRKDTTSPDFLHILCNLLQICENRLQYLRLKLAKALDYKGQQALLSEPPPSIATVEDDTKKTWEQAAALWHATDQVVRKPDLFNVSLTVKHVRYVLNKNNLPVVEMIRWARPDLFEITPSSPLTHGWVSVVAGIIGAVFGLIGGFAGGLKQLNRVPVWKWIFAGFAYGVGGMLGGSAMGLIMGSSFGLQTGHLMTAVQLGVEASYLNPFHEPRGTKFQQAVALRREQLLFDLAHTHRKRQKELILAKKASL